MEATFIGSHKTKGAPFEMVTIFIGNTRSRNKDGNPKTIASPSCDRYVM